MNRLDGPGLPGDRLVYDYLTRHRKVSTNSLPKELQNSVVKKSKTDGVGQIVVRRMTGMEQNPALAVVKRFAEAAGGKLDVAEKLEAVEETLSKEERYFLQLLKSDKRKSIAHLMAEAMVRPTKGIEKYATGALALGKMEAVIEVAREQPNIVKDLLRHALDQTDICQTCVGQGMVPGRKGSLKENVPCPMCGGRKTKLSVSDHKEFATKQLMTFTKMIEPEKGNTINVQQNVGLKIGSGSFMEKVLRTSDEVLYGKKGEEGESSGESSSQVIEAEVVQPEDSSKV